MSDKPYRFWFHLDKGKWLPYKPGEEPLQVALIATDPEMERIGLAWEKFRRAWFNALCWHLHYGGSTIATEELKTALEELRASHD